MKRYLLLLLLSPSLIIAQENEMIPLGQYIDESGELDYAEGLYVSYRCIGLYSMMLPLIQQSKNEETPMLVKKLEDAQTTLIMSASGFYRLTSPSYSEEEFTNNMTISVMPMVNNYQLEANKSWTNTGSYFNDYLQEEGEVCKMMTTAFAKAFAEAQ